MAVQLAARPRHFFCPRIPLEPDMPAAAAILDQSATTPTNRNSPSASPKQCRRSSARTDKGSAPVNGNPLATQAKALHTLEYTGLNRDVKARAFLSSLLASSPFAGVFKTPIADSTSGMRRSHSTSDVDDVHHDINVAPVTPLQHLSIASPLEQAPSNGRQSQREPFQDGSVLGLRLLSKLGYQPSDAMSTRSRSSTDLPSLSSMTSTFPKDSTTPGMTTPPQQLSHAVSQASLPDENSRAEPALSSAIGMSVHSVYCESSDRLNCAADPDIGADEELQLSLGHLTLPLLKSALATCSVNDGDDSSTNDTRFLVNSIRTVFSDSDALNRSFLVETEDSGNDTTRHPSGLDLAAVREAYKLLVTLPKDTFLRPMANAMEILLARLQLNMAKLQSAPPERWRQLLILLENPLLKYHAYHDSLLSKLCLIIGAMRTKARSIFVQWFSTYDAKGLGDLIRIFQGYLVDHFQRSPQRDEALVASVKALSLLYSANEAAKPEPLVELSTFYTEDLYRKLNFKEEYKTWRKSLENGPSNVSVFSYFNYPFLFDPVTKTRIMHIDAMVQMSLEFEDAFVHQALVVHAQKFLHDSPSVAQLEENLKGRSNPFLVLEVRRDKLVQDVLEQVKQKTQDLKKPLKVRFIGGGEEGMDQGGVQKEFFQVIVNMLLDPAYGMFTYDEETRYCWINGASLESEKEFELVGTIVGLALYNGVILDVNFPKVMYKRLLDEVPTLEDVKEGWPALGRGLQQLLDWSDGDVGDVFLRTFEISYDVYGQVKNFPLVDGGENLIVTNQDRKQYVDLYIHHFVVESTRRQFTAFRRGFYKICGGRALKMCRPSELELLICGTATDEINFTELEDGAQYDDGYDGHHQVIVWFWEIVHEEMDLDQKKKLLNFVTASDRAPLNGLGSLTFVIQRNGPDTDR
ncbi:hypothetical protein PhCBS80983_g04445 [Powellomyces hirtus]|uniref:HECT-type E3 ubiquitin transferase n=1 Tax=Powellomyces hirtus TaxID=109895 RepID=A0A507DYH8_9FUNG|nr:hypothetical protein PhCBS80983_g04445 [Powellomyces hirtus]